MITGLHHISLKCGTPEQFDVSHYAALAVLRKK